MKQTIAVKNKEENPELAELIPLEQIADAIIKVSEAFEQIAKSRLTKRAIVLLLQDSIGFSKITKKEIEAVLDHAPKLKDAYLKKKI